MTEIHSYWSRHEIKTAISRWVDEHGDIPKKDEWKQGGEYWPPESIVRYRFGTWNKAIRASGFTPRSSFTGAVGVGEPLVRMSFHIELAPDLHEKFVQKCGRLGYQLRPAAREAILQWIDS